MRRSCLLAAALLLVGNVGCFIPRYPSDPNERMEALLVDSENIRQIRDEWKRFWFIDQPSHMTFDRIHGGIE
jgi:hypothetical protein